MSKQIKIIAFSILAIIIIAIAGYNYVLHGGERNLSNEDAAFSVTSKKILIEFTTDAESCNKKYLDKAIVILGTITSIRDKELILDNSIICNLKNTDATLKVNQIVSIKGRVVGYDDLLAEIKLDQCFKAL